MAGQKLKTHKGAKKRFHRTGTGKLFRRQANMRHILTTKPRYRKRRLSKMVEVSRENRDGVRLLLPYLS